MNNNMMRMKSVLVEKILKALKESQANSTIASWLACVGRVMDARGRLLITIKA